MPKNNGKTRKTERKYEAKVRNTESLKYTCGHMHVSRDKALECSFVAMLQPTI